MAYIIELSALISEDQVSQLYCVCIQLTLYYIQWEPA